jgi:hypothetical protein
MESPASPDLGSGEAAGEREPSARAEAKAAEGGESSSSNRSSSSKSPWISGMATMGEKGWGSGEANPISLHGQREKARTVEVGARI